MHAGAAQQRRHVLAEPEKLHRARQVRAARPVRAAPRDDRGYSGASQPSIVADDVERRVDAAARSMADRVEQQIEPLLRNDLADEDHAAGNRGAPSAGRAGARGAMLTIISILSPPMPCAISSPLRERRVGDEPIDEPDRRPPPQETVEPAGRRRVPSRATTRTPRSAQPEERRDVSQRGVEVRQKDVRRPDRRATRSRSSADARDLDHHLPRLAGVSARRVNGYQYGPIDQLAPAASASGVIRKFSQPLTIA